MRYNGFRSMRQKKDKKEQHTLPEKGPEPTFPPAMTLWTLFWKTTLLALFFTFLFFLATAVVIGFWGYSKFEKFSQSAGVSFSELQTIVQEGWSQPPLQENNHKNILILGVDSLEGRGNVPPLTDTIMLLSVNLESGKINTLPLPRDLWNEDYQTKINSLYFYGQEKYPENPQQFSKEVIENMTGVPIHHTVVLSLDVLEKLIDQAGGVTLDIPTGFIDTTFPRPGVDVTTVRDPAVLYQTVEFQPGKQTLSGERALQYIRSRHSDGDTGTDLSRGERQQLVIRSLFTQLLNVKQYIAHPELAGAFYRLYTENFSQAIPLKEGISTAKTLLPKRENITFASHQLTTTKEQPKTGVIDNPKLSPKYQNQWVYVITNPESFKKEVQQALFQ